MTCFDVIFFCHLKHFSWAFIGQFSRFLSFVSVQFLKLSFFSDRADSVQHSSASISTLQNFSHFLPSSSSFSCRNYPIRSSCTWDMPLHVASVQDHAEVVRLLSGRRAL